MAGRDATARVGHLDNDAVALAENVDAYFAFTRHGINGILAQILDDPFEKRCIDAGRDVLGGQAAMHTHAV